MLTFIPVLDYFYVNKEKLFLYDDIFPRIFTLMQCQGGYMILVAKNLLKIIFIRSSVKANIDNYYPSISQFFSLGFNILILPLVQFFIFNCFHVDISYSFFIN